MKERKLVSKRELLVFAAVIFICLIVLLFRSFVPDGGEIVIESGGEVLYSFSMSSITEPQDIQISGEQGIELVVRVDSEGAEILESDCPDQVCVRIGKISKPGESAICLPARVVVRISGDGGYDGATY